MSISSSFYADYAEKMKDQWTTELMRVINEPDVSSQEKLEAIKYIVHRIEQHHFEE